MLFRSITKIGGYWDRKGESEIDLIVVNELEKRALFVEIKRKAENISIEKLMEKSVVFRKATGELKDYNIEFKGYSLSDM